MVILTSLLVDQISVLLGAIFGAVTMALIPYWNVIRNNEALGLPPITFDKKFLGTLLIALCAGVVAGFYYFNSAVTTIDTTQTVIQLFATAAIASAVSNRALNSLLTVSSTTTTVKTLQDQNKALQDEINVMKLKVASLDHPLKHELKQGAPITPKGTVVVSTPVSINQEPNTATTAAIAAPTVAETLKQTNNNSNKPRPIIPSEVV